MLWQEAQIARERVNTRIATEALLIDATVAKHMGGDGSHFKALIEGLLNG